MMGNDNKVRLVRCENFKLKTVPQTKADMEYQVGYIVSNKQATKIDLILIITRKR